jgi:hypothetical protein
VKKNFYAWSITVMIIGFLPCISLSQTITKVGEWGTGYYGSVFVKGNYAYCTAGLSGFDIIDVSIPANPKKVGGYMIDDEISNIIVIGNYAYAAANTMGLQVVNITNPALPYLKGSWISGKAVKDVFIKGQYAYIANSEASLAILNIANPEKITLAGSVSIQEEMNSIYVSGNYAYVIAAGYTESPDQYSNLYIFDISSPAAPTLVSMYKAPAYANDIWVKENYAYITACAMCLQIVDISNPAAPKLAAQFDNMKGGGGIFIMGNYAYIASGEIGLQVLDISIPTSPTLVGNYNTPGDSSGIMVNGNYAYVGDKSGGLQIIDISTPSKPIPVGSYDYSFSNISRICLRGNYTYLVSGPEGLIILDISNPSRPTLAGCFDTPGWAESVDVRNNLAYVADGDKGLLIINVSNPSAPSFKGSCLTPQSAFDVKVSSNYAFVLDWRESALVVIDVSNPSSPKLLANRVSNCSGQKLQISGNHAYVADVYTGLKIINIANPIDPILEATFDIPLGIENLFVSGHYAYVGNEYNENLWILDIAVPNHPGLVKQYTMPGRIDDLVVDDHFLYTANYSKGLSVVDISMPYNPTIAARYTAANNAEAVAVNGDYIYLSNGSTGKLYILHMDRSTASPRLKVNHANLYFAAELSGDKTYPQFLLVSNSGAGTMTWSVSTNKNWLKLFPASGIDDSEISVTADPAGLAPGIYNAVLTISAPLAANTPLEVEVQFQVYKKGQTSTPFGEFATPTHGSTVSSSVPFTGWVLDDIGVQNVQLFRDSAQGLVYIGDAVLVEGARPDVEQTYPNYPMNYKAGWGYMMLTNFLPGGNGVFTIHALATDIEGNQVTLGSKTITVDNASAVKPFGAIDSPAQGGTASGNEYVNFAWVLTPPPNTISTDGSTIRVWVDGVSLGNPVYNRHRQDIAALFPDYNNSGGAGGYFYLDTTKYANGVHTIQWTAADDAGNRDGIGSRYFTVLNAAKPAASAASTKQSQQNLPLSLPDPQDMQWNHHVKVAKGFPDENLSQTYYKGENNTISLEIKELDRVEIHLSEEPSGTWMGCQVVGNQIRNLPIGSTLDIEKGIFCWQVGAGFIGRYRLVFIERDQKGNILSGSKIVVKIMPKF